MKNQHTIITVFTSNGKMLITMILAFEIRPGGCEPIVDEEVLIGSVMDCLVIFARGDYSRSCKRDYSHDSTW